MTLPIFLIRTKLEELLCSLSESALKKRPPSVHEQSEDITLAAILNILFHYKQSRETDRRVLYKFISGKKNNDKAWRYIQTEIVRLSGKIHSLKSILT